MNPLRTILVDDEPLARRRLRQLLAAHTSFPVVGEYGTVAAALEGAGACRADVVFLDVQMPEGDGFEFLARAPATLRAVVFVTAFQEHAVRAFEVNAIDYLVKPVAAARLALTLDRIRARGSAAVGPPRADPLHALLGSFGLPAPSPAYADRLLVPSARGDVVVPVREIDWLAADGSYVTIVTAQRRHVLRGTLAAVETRLDPAMFLRLHRSALVNVDRVRALRRTSDGRCDAVLADGTAIPVSRRRLEQVAERLGRLGS